MSSHTRLTVSALLTTPFRLASMSAMRYANPIPNRRDREGGEMVRTTISLLPADREYLLKLSAALGTSVSGVVGRLIENHRHLSFPPST